MADRREIILKVRQSGFTYSQLGALAERAGLPADFLDIFRTGGRYYEMGDTGGVFYPDFIEDEPDSEEAGDHAAGL